VLRQGPEEISEGGKKGFGRSGGRSYTVQGRVDSEGCFIAEAMGFTKLTYTQFTKNETFRKDIPHVFRFSKQAEFRPHGHRTVSDCFSIIPRNYYFTEMETLNTTIVLLLELTYCRIFHTVTPFCSEPLHRGRRWSLSY
jgi:hypothetical protein